MLLQKLKITLQYTLHMKWLIITSCEMPLFVWTRPGTLSAGNYLRQVKQVFLSVTFEEDIDFFADRHSPLCLEECAHWVIIWMSNIWLEIYWITLWKGTFSSVSIDSHAHVIAVRLCFASSDTFYSKVQRQDFSMCCYMGEVIVPWKIIRRTVFCLSLWLVLSLTSW